MGNPTAALGAALREHRWTVRDLAWALGSSTLFIENLLDKAVFVREVALQLEAAGLGRAEACLDAQRDHDLFELRDRMGGELALIQSAALRLCPDRA